MPLNSEREGGVDAWKRREHCPGQSRNRTRALAVHYRSCSKRPFELKHDDKAKPQEQTRKPSERTKTQDTNSQRSPESQTTYLAAQNRQRRSSGHGIGNPAPLQRSFRCEARESGPVLCRSPAAPARWLRAFRLPFTHHASAVLSVVCRQCARVLLAGRVAAKCNPLRDLRAMKRVIWGVKVISGFSKDRAPFA